jgi:outer membrane protein assembly factor BamD
VLGANYPGSKWYQRSYELIRRHTPAAAAPQAS